MKYWAITIGDLGGHKGFFNSISEIADWLVLRYQERREDTKEWQEQGSSTYSKKALVYTLPEVPKSTLLEHYVHIINIERTNLPVRAFLRTAL